MQEKLGADAPEGTDVETLYARALGTKLFDDKNATEEFITLVEARASYHRREVDTSRKCCDRRKQNVVLMHFCSTRWL